MTGTLRAIRHALVVIVAFCAVGVAGAHAADLHHHYYGEHRPNYFGKYEPWSVRSERPPRKGYWRLTQPVVPTVNFLVPMRRHARRIVPWTADWFAYCERRWGASFNANTGTILTPDGVRLCR